MNPSYCLGLNEMLVLSRKKEEEIIIGENIVVTVIQVRRGRVRIGIKAPKDIRIVRGELLASRTITTETP